MADWMAGSWRMSSGTLLRARAGRRRGATVGSLFYFHVCARGCFVPCTAPLSSIPPALPFSCALTAAFASPALRPMNFLFGFFSTGASSPSMSGPKSATARSASISCVRSLRLPHLDASLVAQRCSQAAISQTFLSQREVRVKWINGDDLGERKMTLYLLLGNASKPASRSLTR